MEVIHFPLLISAPKEIPLTIEQFDNLSIMGLSCFMISYPISISDMGDYVLLHCHDWQANHFHDMPRFKEVIPGRIYESVEMGEFTIPKATELYATIEKYFKHLFLKPN